MTLKRPRSFKPIVSGITKKPAISRANISRGQVVLWRFFRKRAVELISDLSVSVSFVLVLNFCLFSEPNLKTHRVQLEIVPARLLTTLAF